MLAAPPHPPAQILVGAQVWIDDGRIAEAKDGWAVALSKGRIAAVGEARSLEAKFPGAARVVLKGGTLMPGFIEGHAHVEGLGSKSMQVDLDGCKSLEEAVRRVQTWAAAHPEGWIVGRGWDQNRWPGKAFPAAKDLDAATGGRPTLLSRVDGHALWANTAALKAAGVTRSTPEPEGGQILHDNQGEPTGILVDRAEELAWKALPKASPAEREKRLLAGLETLLRHGFSAVADMGVDGGAVALYRKLAAEGRLPIRVFAYLNHEQKLMLQELRGRRPAASTFFQVQGVKFYLDGALGSRGARLLEPYADAPGQVGLLVTSPAKVEHGAAITLRAGYQPAIHAIGDAANRVALDLLIRASKKASKAILPRIEHAQIVTPEDASRFGPSGIIASVQPVHCTSDHAWTPARLGPKRLEEAFPWRRFLDGGAVMPFGSDAPVEDPNPFFGLASAETRQDPEGEPPGGFLPSQRLTRAESVRGFTWANGKALLRKDLGVIKAGAAADLLWVEAPMATLPPEALRKLKPGRVWINGQEVALPKQ
jgi:predicted amidohydrolase YtcJ